MEAKQKIENLQKFKSMLSLWQQTQRPEIRSAINQAMALVRRIVLEAGCFGTLTLTPPTITGGLIRENVDPFSSVLFEPPYDLNIIGAVLEMLDRTIGVLSVGPAGVREEAKIGADLASDTKYEVDPIFETTIGHF
jgi:hypothetical protein